MSIQGFVSLVSVNLDSREHWVGKNNIYIAWPDCLEFIEERNCKDARKTKKEIHLSTSKI
jgi:hypothetical protein